MRIARGLWHEMHAWFDESGLFYVGTPVVADSCQLQGADTLTVQTGYNEVSEATEPLAGGVHMLLVADAASLHVLNPLHHAS